MSTDRFWPNQDLQLFICLDSGMRRHDVCWPFPVLRPIVR